MNCLTKFRCTEVKLTAEGLAFTLAPAITPSPENDKVFKSQPSGSVQMGIVDPSYNFTPGREYYVTISDGKNG